MTERPPAGKTLARQSSALAHYDRSAVATRGSTMAGIDGATISGGSTTSRAGLSCSMLLAWALAFFCNTAWAGTLEDLDFKHGIAFFHDLKYPADYTHLDYLNPDAPKGGELVLPTQSAFNTLAPMATRGIGAPQGFWFTLDTLLIRAGDEVSAFYGRLADGVLVRSQFRGKVLAGVSRRLVVRRSQGGANREPVRHAIGASETRRRIDLLRSLDSPGCGE